MRSHRLGWLFLGFLTLSALAFALLRPAQASEGPRLLVLEMTRAAGEIKAWLAKRPSDSQSVSVQPFISPRDSRANGEVLMRLLREELRKAGVEIRERGTVGVSGIFRLIDDKVTRVRHAVIEISLDDGSDAPAHRLAPIGIHSPEAITTLFPLVTRPSTPGILVAPKPGDKPFVEHDCIRTSKDGKFAIEVLVADKPSAKMKDSDYRKTKIRLDEDLPFADVKLGQAYAIRVHNNADHEAAVSLAVDGLSMFHFAEPTLPRGGYILLSKRSSLTIRGWFVRLEQSRLFVVTERASGVWVSSGMPPSKVGRITLQFHACWANDSTRPPDEPAELVASRDPLATGFGPEDKADFHEVKRKIGRLRETIAVLYDRPRE